MQLQFTLAAEQQISALRARHKTAYEAFERDLVARGCAALDYRLTGTGVDHFCVKHLRDSMRVVVAFDTETAWVLLVARHDATSPMDVYAQIYRSSGVEPPKEPRTKPPCCDEAEQPPQSATEEVDHLVRRLRNS